MFKKAVESHNATQPAQTSLKSQLFPSSSPSSSQTTGPASKQTTLGGGLKGGIKGGFTGFTRPALHPTKEGERRMNGATTASITGFTSGFGGSTGFGSSQTRGIKRSSNGLAKACVDHDPFTDEIEINENDFDSDIDIDGVTPDNKRKSIGVDGTSGKSGVVKYPDLPEKIVYDQTPFEDTPRRPKVLLSSSLPRVSPLPRASPLPQVSAGPRLSPRASFHTEATTQSVPWSSSPVDHYGPPVPVPAPPITAATAAASLGQFRYQDKALAKPAAVKKELDTVKTPVPAQTQTQAPAGKRRLFWLEEDAEQKDAETKASNLPWNTTASAIKEQQRTLRQANKKATTTSKKKTATDEVKTGPTLGSRSKKGGVAKVFLSEEQQHVLNLVVEHQKSVFFTGSAGTGKSVLLRQIIASLRKKYLRESDRVAVTASTGLAACNIGGVTLHSFAGIGLGKEPVAELAKKIRRNAKAKHRWMRTKVLVVDEISMVDGELFDKLEQLARTIRNNGRPFGGIQLVVTGDFFQLPPVPDSGRVARFAFDAGTWNTSIEHTIGLTHVFRQKDPVFAGMLNEMREGRLTPRSIAAFRTLDRDLPAETDIDATELFPTRAEVETANNWRMRQLVGEVQTFHAKDAGTIQDPAQRTKLLQNCMAPEVVSLKKGAQVMLIKNIDETLVNGSLGKVIGFMSEQTFDKYSDNEEAFRVAQASIDSSTANTGGSDEEDTSDILNKMSAAQKKKVADIHERLLLASTSQSWPVVRFSIADGTTRDLLCQREQWKVELPNGEVQASRHQIPLILAWALSIHKAQGQTLQRVKVDLGKVFEKGQAYVALSRATSMGGLQVSRFDPKKVVAHERVRTFYANLSSAAGVASARDKDAAT